MLCSQLRDTFEDHWGPLFIDNTETDLEHEPSYLWKNQYLEAAWKFCSSSGNKTDVVWC